MILERLKLNTKLNLGFGMVILFLFLSGMQGIYSQFRLNESTKQNGEQLLAISNIKEANINLIYIARAIRQMALVQNQKDRDNLKQSIFKNREIIRQHVDLSKKYVLDDRGLKEFSGFEVHFSQYNQDIDHVISLINSGKSSNVDVINFLTDPSFIENFKAADNALSSIAKQNEIAANNTSRDALALYHNSIAITIAFIGAGVLISLVFGLIIGFSIRKPAGRLQVAVKAIADGKLDIQVPHTDYPNEIGELAVSVGVLQVSAQKIEEQSWVKSEFGPILKFAA